jgi:hypothetical protein
MIKKDYLDLVTREEAEKFWNIQSAAAPRNLPQDTRNYAKVSGSLLTYFSVVRRMKNTTRKSSKKTTKPPIVEAAAPAPASVAEDMPESKEEQHAVVTLRAEFLDVQAKHAVAPIAFRETQRDFKRYAAVIAATSVEDVKVGAGEAFKDEKDLRSFMRWILRGAPGHKPTTAKA